MAITKLTCIQVRTQLELALKTIGEQHGIRFDIGKIRFNDVSFRCTLNAEAKNQTIALATNAIYATTVPSTGTKDLNFYMNRSYRKNANCITYTVIEFHPSRPKYKFVVSTPYGTRYRADAKWLDSMKDVTPSKLDDEILGGELSSL